MQIVVQKFGGTSVQTEENRNHVIQHIKNALMNNYKLVVVVSALGRKPAPYATDTLLDLVDFPKIIIPIVNWICLCPVGKQLRQLYCQMNYRNIISMRQHLPAHRPAL